MRHPTPLTPPRRVAWRSSAGAGRPESSKAGHLMHPTHLTHPHLAARRRLGVALDDLFDVFHGMTAHPDEHNCSCHWGSAEEVALLKTPDVELEPDLLRRSWEALDWTDHAAVLRRILPQFATALVAGRVRPLSGLEEAGYSFARGRWQRWPDEQNRAVSEFLHAWWVQSLTDPDAAVPAHQVFAMCAEASGTLRPWLADWETHPREPQRPTSRRGGRGVGVRTPGRQPAVARPLARARRGGTARRTGRLAAGPRRDATAHLGRTGGPAAPDTAARPHRRGPLDVPPLARPPLLTTRRPVTFGRPGRGRDRVRSCPPSGACRQQVRSAGTRCPSDWSPAVRGG